MHRKTLLVTSIPPNLKRITPGGDDIGSHYQKACIDSWERSSFTPISVNSTREEISHGLALAHVNNDATHITGKPHVFLADLLLTGIRHSEGRPFCITNADILFADGNGLAQRVNALRKGEILMCHRTDIKTLDPHTFEVYSGGYDFFALHPDDASRLNTKMIFGAPWWDQLLPLAMLFAGCSLKQFPADQTLHLKHEDRWSWKTWQTMGLLFLDEITTFKERDEYQMGLLKAQKRQTGRILSDLKYRIWKSLPSNARNETFRMLERVAAYNGFFIDSSLSQVNH